MNKVDYRKKYHELYSPSSKQVQRVTVPPMQFAMVGGRGTPEGPEHSQDFQDAIGALYGITYTLKMERKKAGINPDYTIVPLEGLWWMANGAEFDASKPKDWRWTLMLFQPEFITREEFDDALTKLKLKKPNNKALGIVRLETFSEGEAIQIMHIGSYASEAGSIALLEDYAREHGYRFVGKHHEIYLGDPRRARPEKLKTILRHPIVRS